MTGVQTCALPIFKGGELKIHYTDERVLMTGKAEKVYDGVVEV